MMGKVVLRLVYRPILVKLSDNSRRLLDESYIPKQHWLSPSVYVIEVSRYTEAHSCFLIRAIKRRIEYPEITNNDREQMRNCVNELIWYVNEISSLTI